MAGLGAPVLEAYSQGYDPEKYRQKSDGVVHIGMRCDCGMPYRGTKYRFNGQDYCLSCALEEAEITPIGVDGF